MAITQDYILKGGLRGSDEAANSRLQKMDEERIGGQKNASDQKKEQIKGDAALANLIKGSQLKAEAIARNQAAADAQAKAQGLKPGTYSSRVSDEGYSFDPRAPMAPGAMLTPGQESADRAFGKEYSDYVAGGGSEAAKKNLGLLENVQKELSDPNAPAPNMIERGIQNLPDGLRALLTPKIKMQEDQVRSAIQGSLRQTLGAQFTEKEGEGLMHRSYDPRLSAAQNLQKMKPEIDALKAQLEQKRRSAEQFERTGSLVGLGAAGGQQAPQAAQPGRSVQSQQPQGGTGLEHLSDEELRAMAKKLGL